MRRIVFRFPLEAGHSLHLDDEQRHYLFDVLRLSPGENIIGLDAFGQAYVVVLKSSHPAICTVLGPAKGQSPPSRLPD